jgi:hypothetical protein
MENVCAAATLAHDHAHSVMSTAPTHLLLLVLKAEPSR